MYKILFHNRLIYFGGILLIAVFISSCLDEIDFDRPETIQDGVAIQGKIIKGNPSRVSVIIRKIFNFQENDRLLNAREVVVFDEEGNELPLSSTADGIFSLEIPNDHPTFSVEYGKSYGLRVSTFDNRTFESSLDELYPAPVPEQLTYNVEEVSAVDDLGQTFEFTRIGYQVSTPLLVEGATEKSRLLWEMETVYKITDSPESYGRAPCRFQQIDEENKTCYVAFDPVNNYTTLDGNAVAPDRVDNFEVLEASASNLYAEGVYLNVIQQSLSPEAYEYWDQVGRVANADGSIFAEPTGKVKTNFTDITDPNREAFGYFYATEENLIRVYVSPMDAGSPNPVCPAPLNQGGNAPPDCCNCLSLSRSTDEKPVWWVE